MAATVTGWIAYALARGDTIGDDALSAAALVRAQDYIDHHYANRFGGAVVVDQTILDAAVYEAAGQELAQPGFWTKTYSPDQQKVLTEVSGIKWTVRGDASGSDAATPVSTKIEAMLRPYMVTVAGAYTV